eukprot:924627-Prymnesium_polylepis.2
MALECQSRQLFDKDDGGASKSVDRLGAWRACRARSDCLDVPPAAAPTSSSSTSSWRCCRSRRWRKMCSIVRGRSRSRAAPARCWPRDKLQKGVESYGETQGKGFVCWRFIAEYRRPLHSPMTV